MIELEQFYGRKCLMNKADVQAAFRLNPSTGADHQLSGIQLERGIKNEEHSKLTY